MRIEFAPSYKRKEDIILLNSTVGSLFKQVKVIQRFFVLWNPTLRFEQKIKLNKMLSLSPTLIPFSSVHIDTVNCPNFVIIIIIQGFIMHPTLHLLYYITNSTHQFPS